MENADQGEAIPGDPTEGIVQDDAARARSSVNVAAGLHLDEMSGQSPEDCPHTERGQSRPGNRPEAVERSALSREMRMTLDLAVDELESLRRVANVETDPGVFDDVKNTTLLLLTEALARVTKALFDAIGRGDEDGAARSQQARSNLMNIKAEAQRTKAQHADRVPPAPEPAVARQPCKPLTPFPKWTGNVKDYFTWKNEVEQYFEVYNFETDWQKLLSLRQPGVLQPDADLATRGCRQYDEFWKRMEERFTPMQVSNEITKILRDLEPIKRKDTDEAKRVLGALTDYVIRMEDNGRGAQLDCDYIVHDAVRKLGPLAKAYPDWSVLNYGKNDWEMKHVLRYLREKIASMALAPETNVPADRARFGQQSANPREWKPKDAVPEKAQQPRVEWKKDFRKGPPGGNEARPPREGAANNRPQAATPAIRLVDEEGRTGEGEAEPSNPATEAEEPPTATSGESKALPFAMISRRGELSFSPTTLLWSRTDKGNLCRLVTIVDEGSDMSLLSLSAAKRLGLELGEPYVLTYGVVGGKLSQKAFNTRLEVINCVGESWKMEVCVVEELPGRSMLLPSDFWDQHEYLSGARGNVPESNEPIELLVGYTLKGLSLPLQIVMAPGCEPFKHPVGMRTYLGWTIFGPLKALSTSPVDGDSSVFHLEAATRSAEPDGEELAKKFTEWCKGEALGVQPTQLCQCRPSVIEENAFLKVARDHVRRDSSGRMEVRLPWKPGFPQCLPNNRRVAAAAVASLKQTLQKRGIHDLYESEMQRIIAEYTERVPTAELDQPCWYLQHFVVANKTKLRIVWNSAAKYQGFSLNLGLEKGPNLLNDLLHVVQRFRAEKIAFVADVEKMFNQVQIAEQDRDFHRFLWGGVDYRWKRLPFGDKSAPDLSIYCLLYLAEEHREDCPRGAKVISQQTYMDDIAGSCSTSEEAEEVIHEIDRILASGKFNVKEWNSNDPRLDTSEEEDSSLLGIPWNKAADTLGVLIPESTDAEVTRRSALSAIAKIWDPLGILAPAVVELKTMLQDLWDTRYGWDTPLGERLSERWREGLARLSQFGDTSIPRTLNSPTTASRLDIFCDASANAFGAAMWVTAADGERRFVQAKTMVAPLKTRTIPRLELLAAQLAARMLKTFRGTFGEVPATIWTDSRVVLHWVRTGARKYKAFVAARLQEIQESVPDFLSTFRHIPGETNPADALTKPMIKTKADLEEWLSGPADDQVPKPTARGTEGTGQDLSKEEMRDAEVEMKTDKEKRKKPKSNFRTTVRDADGDGQDIEDLAADADSWPDLLDEVQRIRTVDRREALLTCFRKAQSGLSTKGLWQDEQGLWRMEGRLNRTGLPDDVRYPILLNGGSTITELFVREAHEEAGHAGQKFLMNFLHARRGVRVTQAKDIFRRVREECTRCHEMYGKRETPLMGGLPPERVLYRQAPFTAVGVDFVGSLPSPQGSLEVVLFTCLTTRVVHLEITHGKGEEDVLRAWKGLTYKRGAKPEYVLTDGARSFVKAKQSITKMQATTNLGPELRWEICYPKAPHRRGAIEAMVKALRRSMQAMVGDRMEAKTLLEWETIIAEINFLMNERPLLDGENPAKATSFTGNSLLFPYADTPEETQTNAIVREAKEAVKAFWEAWYDNVPAELFDRKKWKDHTTNVKVGDRVLVVKGGYGNNALPRKYWPKGTIVQCTESRDGVVRKVVVEMEGGIRERHVVQNLVVISR